MAALFNRGSFSLSRGLCQLSSFYSYGGSLHQSYRRPFHSSRHLLGIVKFNLADIGEGIAEVELLKWHKNVGEKVEEMEAICEVQSDKAAVEITSRYTGTILELKHKVGELIKIGDVLISLDCPDEPDSEETTTALPPSAAPTKSEPSIGSSRDSAGEGVAIPAARRLAKELGVDISMVKGTGRGGRITKDDVEAHAKGGAAPAARAPVAAPVAPSPQAAAPIKVPTRPQKENRTVQLRGFRRAMVKSMTETAKIPHLNIGEEIDVTNLMNMRIQMKAAVEKEYGIRLTVTSLIVKAVSLALHKHPILNSKLTSDSEYTISGSHNVSIAIDTPSGLVVPNMKNVQDMNIMEIQSELQRLQQLAQTNKLSADDLTGGTVCISNVGVIAGTYVKALLFDNQSMIIGIGKTQTVPKFNDKGEVVPRQVLNFGFSADHRHCDGATVARYTADLKQYLEEPELMLLHMN
eukprot:GHVS01103274.1.p1 GENE.GHVS01103274.1~~GHVS01103274.1.p1  ORF type:complete len:464 (-),score=61.73 GHVS01103274.1:463-1854(-)